MKPWLNLFCVTHCYICGREGWNLNAADEWRGARFRCADGCNPADIQANQVRIARQMIANKIAAMQNQQLEQEQGAGI